MPFFVYLLKGRRVTFCRKTAFFLSAVYKRTAVLVGDDLEAVLEALETDDNVNEYFEEAVAEVSVGIRFYSNIQQRSRSF